MGPLVLAWLTGEGIVIWRWARNGAPPTPGALAAASGFFVLCAILAEYQPARTVATLLAWGVDAAALLQILPGAKVTQDTGWPPIKIDDPTVLLPRGSAGNGNLLPEGGSAAAGSGPDKLGEQGGGTLGGYQEAPMLWPARTRAAPKPSMTRWSPSVFRRCRRSARWPTR